MSLIQEVLIPNIGDFDGVEVIEVLVKSGDFVSLEDPLITMESDKASMDVPSPFNGEVKDVLIKAGDKVSQNDLILTLAVEESKIDSSKTSIKSTVPPKKNEPYEKNTQAEESNNSKLITTNPTRPPPPVNPKIEHKNFLLAHASPSVRTMAPSFNPEIYT